MKISTLNITILFLVILSFTGGVFAQSMTLAEFDKLSPEDQGQVISDKLTLIHQGFFISDRAMADCMNQKLFDYKNNKKVVEDSVMKLKSFIGNVPAENRETVQVGELLSNFIKNNLCSDVSKSKDGE